MKKLTILTSLFFALFLLISAVKITLNFRQLYYFDIDYLNITDYTDLEKDEIIANYNVLIDYLIKTNKDTLQFPSLPMSEEGRIHFEDVKKIFIKLDYLMYASLFISIIGIYFLIKKHDYLFLKYTSYFLLGIPILLFIPFMIDFNAVFTLFHNIAFTNDYWLLDPSKDPIINLLPERFFMHCALMILVIITLESFLLTFLYQKFVRRYIKKHNLS